MTEGTRARLRWVIKAALAIGIVAAIVLPPSCVRRPTPATHVPPEVTTPTGGLRPVRVLIAENVSNARVSIAAPYMVEPWGKRARGKPAILAQCAPLREGAVQVTKTAIIVGERHFSDDAVHIRIERRAALTVDGRRYRGSLVVLRTGEDQLALINVLPIEDYLYGVLGGETYPAWPAAALEAQAIIARSYALWRMADRRGEPFDLHSTVMDQNYLGMAKEDPRLTAAVDRTAGIVLLFQLKLFRCYYHSTCGGHTEAVQEVFPDPPLLPLSGVACKHCKDSKHYAWKRVITRAELSEALSGRALGSRPVASLAVTRRTASGRAAEVTLGAAGASPAAMAASEFRLAVGPAKLPSTFFQLREVPGGYEFTGRGFGHGVGMCQWGARGMAEAGYSAAGILHHYYPGSELHRLY